MEKCDFCSYNDIDKIVFDDIAFDKCIKCNTLKLPILKYETLLKSHLSIENFANLKKCIDFDDITEEDNALINVFMKYMDIDNFFLVKEKNSNKQCNLCKDNVLKFRNRDFKDFTIYVCKFCNSIYFNKEEFKEACDYFMKKANRQRKWIVLSMKIKKFFKKKNNRNVKE